MLGGGSNRQKKPRLTVCLVSSNSIYHEEWAYAKAIHGQGRDILLPRTTSSCVPGPRHDDVAGAIDCVFYATTTCYMSAFERRAMSVAAAGRADLGEPPQEIRWPCRQVLVLAMDKTPTAVCAKTTAP